MISVLVLTRNEERDLPGCLASVAWCDDVHVLDSHSTDATAEVARRAGAAVWLRVFDNYAAQRNFGLALPFRHPWVLILDADERMTEGLRTEMEAFLRSAAAEGTAAGRMRRRDFLRGTWLRRVQASAWYIRLVRPRRASYVREVNERLLVDGAIHDFAGHFDHFPFSKGMAHWISKHNTYSTMEADCVRESLEQHVPFSIVRAFTARDFNERRYHQKELFYRLPGRPVIKFLFLYVVRGGFLDGRAGFTYAALQAIYEYFIVLKTAEARAERETTATERARELPATSRAAAERE